MKCPKCEHERWAAHQVVHNTIIVDEFDQHEEDIESYHIGKPFGPYTCVGCGHEVDELELEEDFDIDLDNLGPEDIVNNEEIDQLQREIEQLKKDMDYED